MNITKKLSAVACAMAGFVVFGEIDSEWLVRAIDSTVIQDNTTYTTSETTDYTFSSMTIWSDASRPKVNMYGVGTLAIGGFTQMTGGGVAMPETQGLLDVNVNGNGPLKILAASDTTLDDDFDSDAYIHVDASAEDAFTMADETHLSVWKDVRSSGGKNVTAGYASEKPTSAPIVRTSELLGGKKIVDLGAYTEGEDICEATGTSYLNFDGANIQEGFMVVRATPKDKYDNCGFLLGYYDGWSNIYNFHRGTSTGSGELLSSASANEHARGGLWRVDGAQVSPISFVLPTNRFTVISFALDEGVLANNFAWDRSYRCGGLEFAEIILYTKELAKEKRRAIDQYLTKKWLGKDISSVATPFKLGAVNFANGVTNRLDIGRDTKAMSMNTTSELIKEGEGTLEVMAISGVNAVDVKGGTLKLYSGLSSLLSEAFFHLDANRTDLMTYDTTGNVSKVMSVVGDGNHVRNTKASRSGAKLVDRVIGETTMKLLDFGEYYCDSEQMNFVTNSAAKAPVGSCGMEMNEGSDQLRTFFVVVEENEVSAAVTNKNQINDQYLLGCAAAIHIDFDRSSKMLISSTSGNGYVVNLRSGTWYYDRLHVAPQVTELKSGLHVIAGRTAGTFAVNQLAQDTGYRIGGLKYGEVLMFKRALSDDEMMLINDYLITKWRAGETYDVETLINGAANIHFDANDLSTLTYYVDKDGVTNKNEIVKINDVRDNGNVATLANSARTNVTITVDEVSGLNMLDFGEYDEVALSRRTNSSGMVIWRDNATTTEDGSYCTAFAVVEKKSVSGGEYGNEQFIFTSPDTGRYDFHGDVNKYLAAWAADSTKNAEWRVNDKSVSPLSDNWTYDEVQVVMIRGNTPMNISGFAQDRTARIGGMRYGEVLLFADKLSDHDAALVEDYLLKKWKKTSGKATIPEITFSSESAMAISSVKTGMGAILTLDGSLDINDDSTLEFTLSREMMSGKVTITGSAELGDEVTLKLALGANGRFPTGKIDLISADTIVNPNAISSWIFDASALGATKAKLGADSKSVYIDISAGLIVIVK